MKNNPFYIRDGFSQKDRFFPELSKSYFPVSGESLPELFNRMNLFAHRKGLPSKEIFRGKLFSVVCSILATRMNTPSIGKGKKETSLLVSRLLWWKKELESSGEDLGDSLLRLISELLESFRLQYRPEFRNGGDSAIWERAFNSLASSLPSLKEKASLLLPTLMTSGENEPALSLYVATIKLFSRVQCGLNELPDKRISFYYRNFLGENPKKEIGDRVYLVLCGIAPGTSREFSKGIQFEAGKNDAGEPIVFETRKRVPVNDAKVAKLMTLAVLDDIPAQWTEIPVHDPSDFPFQEEQTPFPIFGMTRSGQKIVGAHFARLGFAFADRVLMMRDGVRKISLRLFFDPSTVEKSPLAQNADVCEFIHSFQNAFRLSLSTKNGWFRVDGYQLESKNLSSSFPDACLGLIFSLSSGDPAICGYDSKIHGDAWNTDLPVLKMEINSGEEPNPWSIIGKFRLRKVQIEASVRETKNLVLHNELGELSPETPFQPFGPIPSRGSSFLVGSPEIVGKRLLDFKIHADWCGLPEHLTDIASLYKGYPETPKTNDFRISVQSLFEGKWYPRQEEFVSSKQLFSRDENTRCLTPSFSISCKDVIRSANISTVIPKDTLDYSPGSKEGFFKITLTSPEGAFQHQNYSQALCDSVIMRALKKKDDAERELPRTPYTPTFENISVSYKAQSEIRVGQVAVNSLSDKIIYLQPFGFDEGTPFSQSGGALFIGLTFSSLPKAVSLYFHLNRDSASKFEHETRGFSWAYLGKNGWQNLPAKNILDDTTVDFTVSGIVTLEIPLGMVKEQSLMPSGFYWLRLIPGKAWRQCCRLFSVYAQGVEAVRVSGFWQSASFSHCKAGTIQKILNAPAGVSSVCQLADSFGGEPEESEMEMRTRVAERLYHHNRALSARDYERLVLEEFPEVFKVKCFPRMDPERPDRLSPGHLLIVPVSPLFKDGRFQWDPRFSGKILLDIRRFLESRAPSSVKISVANPDFEKIQVRCRVSIRKGIPEGEKLKELNAALNRYISPWYNPGPTKHFGWCLKESEVKAFVQSMDFVDKVSEFSLMRIASRGTRSFCMDNIDEKDDSGFFLGRSPWSVPVPIRSHYIHVDSESGAQTPVVPGYGDLEIGSTFIIQEK